MSTRVECVSGLASFKLAHAILLYMDSSKSVSYASVHDVQEDKRGRFSILEGIPATRSAVSELMKGMSQVKEKKAELIPPNILAQGDDYMVWYCKPQNRSLWFKSPELGGEVTANIHNPGLVFFLAGSEWYVFATKCESRPDANEPLFVAPYFNVWDGGKICTGSISKPKGKNRWNAVAWEEAFFRSYFTHPNIHLPRKLVDTKVGPYGFWKAMLDGKYAKFPNRVLVPANITLKQAFKWLIVDKMEVE